MVLQTSYCLSEHHPLLLHTFHTTPIATKPYSSQVACIYGTGGKCQLEICQHEGMLTLERLSILHNAFDRAKQSGIYDMIQPPLKISASELLGLSLCFALKVVNAKQGLHWRACFLEPRRHLCFS
eukprot:1151802-Pelagomonas_calceolata.AAC.2